MAMPMEIAIMKSASTRTPTARTCQGQGRGVMGRVSSGRAGAADSQRGSERRRRGGEAAGGAGTRSPSLDTHEPCRRPHALPHTRAHRKVGAPVAVRVPRHAQQRRRDRPRGHAHVHPVQEPGWSAGRSGVRTMGPLSGYESALGSAAATPTAPGEQRPAHVRSLAKKAFASVRRSPAPLMLPACCLLRPLLLVPAA